MSTEIYGATSLIGGGAGALDARPVATLGDLDAAIVITATYVYHYTYDSTSAAAENSPDVICPDDNGGNGRWLLKYSHGLARSGANADIISMTGLTIDGVAVEAIDSDIEKAILGDAKGRISRQAYIWIQDGTAANSIKCMVSSRYNGDAIGATDNITKGATVGNFTLDATGSALKIEAAGLSGNCVKTSGNKFYNASNSTIEGVDVKASGNDINFNFYTDNAGNVLDLTAALAGAESIMVSFDYLTNA